MKDWHTGSQNYGMMLRERNEAFNHSGVKRFVSSEGSEAFHRPKLMISYQTGGGAPRETITAALPGDVTMDFVYIAPGTFTMGSPFSEPLRWDDEGPQHQVTINRGFYLGKYEVTQGQWEAVMENNPSYFRGINRPAVYVSWNDAQAFIHKLNVAAGDSLYRLSAEAEWEYAARAGTTTQWSFGDDESKLGDYAWYDDNAWSVGERYAHRVGTKLPNSWGLDMHGNVYEWCPAQAGRFFGGPHPPPFSRGAGEGGRRLRGRQAGNCGSGLRKLRIGWVVWSFRAEGEESHHNVRRGDEIPRLQAPSE